LAFPPSRIRTGRRDIHKHDLASMVAESLIVSIEITRLKGRRRNIVSSVVPHPIQSRIVARIKILGSRARLLPKTNINFRPRDPTGPAFSGSQKNCNQEGNARGQNYPCAQRQRWNQKSALWQPMRITRPGARGIHECGADVSDLP
jgi:hypothetical protein